MRVSILAILCVLPVSSLKLVQRTELSDDGLSDNDKSIYDMVDHSCKMTVDTKAQKLYLRSETGNFVVSDGKVHDESGNVIGSTPPRPMICESDTGTRNTTKTNDEHSFIIVASSAPYMWHYLSPLFNKHCYAKANKMTYYLWFGDANQEFINAYKTKSEDAAHCSAGLGPHTHYFYPIGMKKVLDNFPVKWLVSMDLSDAWINGAHQHDNALRKVLTEKPDYKLSDVAFAAQLGATRTFCNGGLWAIKNTEWSKQWLADVYKNRCSDMNQLAYWHTTLIHFQKENPAFTFSSSAMGKYNSARGHMPGVAKQMLSPEQQEVFRVYRSSSTNILREPLYFGQHFMLLPNAKSPSAAPGSFIGFRGDRDGGEPVLCHRPMDHAMLKQKTDGHDGVASESESESEDNALYEEDQSNSNNCLRGKTMCTGGGSCMCDA